MQAPMVKLSDEYKLVDGMEALVEAYPSMLDCKTLVVKGPVYFAAGIALKGDVTITNKTEEPVTMIAGEYVDTSLDLTAPVPVGAC